jgi:transcriptional regulator with XRE-family HTH domain
MASSPRHVTPPAEARIGEVLRGLRERQGLSLRSLATRAGFSASFLSQLEHGQVSPSITSLDRIAANLGVTLVDLFEATQEREAVVVKAGRRPGFTSSWSRARVESLSGPSARPSIEALCITLSPKGCSGTSSTRHDSDRFAYVLEGSLTLHLNDDAHRLATGDAVVIPKGHPHRWQNDGARPAQVLLVSPRSNA